MDMEQRKLFQDWEKELQPDQVRAQRSANEREPAAKEREKFLMKKEEEVENPRAMIEV